MDPFEKGPSSALNVAWRLLGDSIGARLMSNMPLSVFAVEIDPD